MKARAFAYLRPTTVAEALDAFAGAAGDASYIAGGQSLVPALALRLQAPDRLIDIAHIAALAGIDLEGETLRIGALTRHAELIDNPLIARHAPLLAEAAPHIAHPAIRNRGTIGGSLALADPAAELPAMMLAAGATIEIAGPDGVRQVAADDFFLDLYQTALAPGELVTAALLPVARPDERFAFGELARRRGDYALVGAGIRARCAGGTVAEVRIAFLSVAATPLRARAAETALAGTALDAAAITRAQAALDDDLDPPDEAHMPAATRRHLARVLLGRLAGRIRETA
ncbi:FAD binding domain-containing protein [Phreatobacter sp. AB_2022a]|uniref:FAD binding domain-containing protein n=1 Tax=Phreatobacter sp. AB_2022a TaxID=3003134 RepID=UPI002287082F|nr:xanthine dehydrogenase family protein subunit M [Phreatobacter sp. AB_2022a]MCZ0736903.1 xanthine dehydrogenase family protein subunit M [Phreatobacter sp. AB_2022a]